MGRQQQRQRQRRDQRRRQAQTQQSQQPPPRKRQSGGFNRWSLAAMGIVILVAVGLFAYYAAHGTSSLASPTATPVPSPVPTVKVPTGAKYTAPIDGIKCGTTEQLAYHIHQYVELYDHGKRVKLPSDIGIPGSEYNPSCYYWLHVHISYPNIIHVESPTTKIFNFGNFVDIWQKTTGTTIPQGSPYVKNMVTAAAKGDLTVYVNGKVWTKGYRTVPLKEHEVIALEIGKPVVKPKPYNNWNGL